MLHNHPLYKVDNASIFDMIKNIVCGHYVAASIASFCRKQDGRVALIALQSQYAGKDIYDQLIKEAEEVLKNRQWSGTTSATLLQHLGLHRKAYITLTKCAEHIPVEFPTGRTCVNYLIDSLQTKNPEVFAALAAVRQDDADKRINFENAFKYLAPTCPVPAKVNKEERSLLMQMYLALKGNTLVA